MNLILQKGIIGLGLGYFASQLRIELLVNPQIKWIPLSIDSNDLRPSKGHNGSTLDEAHPIIRYRYILQQSSNF